MSKYIHWCLVELETRLTGRLSVPERKDLLAEFEAHLYDAKSEYEATGLNSELAELKAVQDFGRPSVVTSECIEALRFGTPQSWFKRNMSYVGIGLAYCVPLFFLFGMCFMTYDTFAPLMFGLVTASVLLLLFGKKVFRQVMLMPIVYGAGAALPVAYLMFSLLFASPPDSVLASGFPINRLQENLQNDRQKVVPYLNQTLEQYQKWRADFYKDPESIRTSEGYVGFFTAQTIGTTPWRSISKGRFESLQAARVFYTKPSFERLLKAELNDTHARIDRYTASLENYPNFGFGRVQESVMILVGCTGLLLVLNIGTFSLGWLYRSLQPKRKKLLKA